MKSSESLMIVSITSIFIKIKPIEVHAKTRQTSLSQRCPLAVAMPMEISMEILMRMPNV